MVPKGTSILELTYVKAWSQLPVRAVYGLSRAKNVENRAAAVRQPYGCRAKFGARRLAVTPQGDCCSCATNSTICHEIWRPHGRLACNLRATHGQRTLSVRFFRNFAAN